MADKSLSEMSHAELYRLRGQPGADQALLAPFEHRAFSREFVQENPLAASVSLPVAIPLYMLAKKLGLQKARSPASVDEMFAGYQGLIEGLRALLAQRNPIAAADETTNKRVTSNGSNTRR